MAARDCGDVAEWKVFQPVGVAHRQRKVADEDQGKAGLGGGQRDQRGGADEERAEDRGQGDGDQAGSDGTVPFAGMGPVGFRIGHVVEQVGAARRRTEQEEGQQGVGRGCRRVQCPGERGCRCDEEVLDPLPRTGHEQDAPGHGAWPGTSQRGSPAFRVRAERGAARRQHVKRGRGQGFWCGTGRAPDRSRGPRRPLRAARSAGWCG